MILIKHEGDERCTCGVCVAALREELARLRPLAAAGHALAVHPEVMSAHWSEEVKALWRAFDVPRKR